MQPPTLSQGHLSLMPLWTRLDHPKEEREEAPGSWGAQSQGADRPVTPHAAKLTGEEHERSKGTGQLGPEGGREGQVTWARGGRAMTLAKAGRTCVCSCLEARKGQRFGESPGVSSWEVLLDGSSISGREGDTQELATVG